MFSAIAIATAVNGDPGGSIAAPKSEKVIVASSCPRIVLVSLAVCHLSPKDKSTHLRIFDASRASMVLPATKLGDEMVLHLVVLPKFRGEQRQASKNKSQSAVFTQKCHDYPTDRERRHKCHACLDGRRPGDVEERCLNPCEDDVVHQINPESTGSEQIRPAPAPIEIPDKPADQRNADQRTSDDEQNGTDPK